MPIKVIAVVAVLFLVVLGTGCREKQISESDLSTVQAILSASAQIDRAMQPLYVCLPEETACYRRSGPHAVEVAERQRKRVEPTLAATENACLEDVGRLFEKSLDEYAQAGRAAVRGNSSGFDAAISRTTRHEIAYVQRLDECGFGQGRLAVVRQVNIAMLKLNEEVLDCETRRCVNRIAREIERQANIGIAHLDQFLAEADEEDEQTCIYGALSEGRATFVTIRRFAVALQEGRYTAAEKHGKRSIEQAARTKQHMAACVKAPKTG